MSDGESCPKENKKREDREKVPFWISGGKENDVSAPVAPCCEDLSNEREGENAIKKEKGGGTNPDGDGML